MFVNTLSLKDFRCYEKGGVSFQNGMNIIYGPNAAGKTNILEALFLLSTARSHRLSRDNEMIRFGTKSAKVSAAFHSRGRENTGEIILHYDKKRQIKINRVPIDKTSDLFGVLNTVLFCPEDLRLVKGAPKERRRMLDLGICRFGKKYFHDLSQYLKVLEQRNTLLRENPDSKALWVWDERLVSIGTQVILARRSYLEQLEKEAARIHQELCGEALSIRYHCGVSGAEALDENAIANRFCCEIKRLSHRETRLGMSLSGPHRDDFELSVNGFPARLYASQGQQRTVTLSLKLAEVALSRTHLGEPPVLLLDDVMSELDAARRAYILGNISGAQVLITCTESFSHPGANEIFVEDVKG